MPVRAAVALGSNVGDRLARIEEARARIARIPGLVVVGRSSIHETEPFGPVPQGPFLNAVDLCETTRTPRALLAELLEIERALGRVREVRWGPRTIDLDLLFHGDAAIESDDLTLPHPGIPERSFVLVPLVEVAPDWVHPVAGVDAASMLEALRAGHGR